jgi:hypothetical protein
MFAWHFLSFFIFCWNILFLASDKIINKRKIMRSQVLQYTVCIGIDQYKYINLVNNSKCYLSIHEICDISRSLVAVFSLASYNQYFSFPVEGDEEISSWRLTFSRHIYNSSRDSEQSRVLIDNILSCLISHQHKCYL